MSNVPICIILSYFPTPIIDLLMPFPHASRASYVQYSDRYTSVTMRPLAQSTLREGGRSMWEDHSLVLNFCGRSRGLIAAEPEAFQHPTLRGGHHASQPIGEFVLVSRIVQNVDPRGPRSSIIDLQRAGWMIDSPTTVNAAQKAHHARTAPEHSH